MRVLLDEQLPRHLARELTGHQVRTVQEQGWAGLKNGELLKQARAAGFEIFLTGDQNLEFQQNLKNSGLFVVILVVASNVSKTGASWKLVVLRRRDGSVAREMPTVIAPPAGVVASWRKYEHR